MHDAEVISVSGDDSAPVGGVTATVEITFRLADEKHTAALTLSPIDGRWVVDESGRGTVTADLSIGSFVSIGGRRCPRANATALLPASYTVAARTGVSLLSGETS